eukprot:TRINITY_DN8740_c0_g1_i1.p1 TRINITY_DN8740_c0_g1~~TRINITY_DN8740_c0_g1_i1.p1  ORF type:complete len:759 (-),score=168.87 TRINITY_DN8740_c0_g1_i1:69-2345(-)
MQPQESQSLSSWVKIGAKCRWKSETTKTFHNVVVTSVDPVKRRVVVHFEADSKVWKTVPYAYIGGAGPLQPVEGVAAGQQGAQAQQVQQAKKGAVAENGAKAEKKADDGTATPPWYEQLWQAESRQGQKQEVKQKEAEVVQRQIDRQQRWQQALQAKAEEEAKQREEERKRSEEAAERERLRILEKLRLEREFEQLRLREVQAMQHEDLLSDKCLNEPERKAARRQREEDELRKLVEQRVKAEEERRQDEERRHEERRREEEERQAKLEEMANRPRVCFGVRRGPETQRVVPVPDPKPPPPPQTPAPEQSLAPPPPPPPGVAEEVWDESQYAPQGQTTHSRWDVGEGDIAREGVAENVDDTGVHEDLAADGGFSTLDGFYADNGNGCSSYNGQSVEQHGDVSSGCLVEGDVGAHSNEDAGWDLPPAAPGVTPGEYYGSRICAIYRQHNLAKLADVPGLMEKYSGCEAEMYDRICEKYGVQPDPHLPAREESPQVPPAVPKQRYAKKAKAPAFSVPSTATTAGRSGGPEPPPSAPPPPPMPKKAPAVSSLMARFQSLLGPGEDIHDQTSEDRAVDTAAAVGPRAPPPPAPSSIQRRRVGEDSFADASRRRSRRPEVMPPPSPPRCVRDVGGGSTSSSRRKDGDEGVPPWRIHDPSDSGVGGPWGDRGTGGCGGACRHRDAHFEDRRGSGGGGAYSRGDGGRFADDRGGAYSRGSGGAYAHNDSDAHRRGSAGRWESGGSCSGRSRSRDRGRRESGSARW